MPAEHLAQQLLRNAAPLLAGVLTTLDIGVVVVDATAPDLPITYVNPAFERLTGHALADVVGHNCRFLQGPDTDPAAVDELRSAVAEQRQCALRLRNYKKDGTAFWSAVRMAPVAGPDGRVVLFVGLIDDVTDRVRREERVLEAEERLRSLLAHLPVVTYSAQHTDRSRLTYVSPQIEALTGFPAAAWLGEADLWYRQLHPEDRERVLEEERRRRGGSGDALADAEYRMITRDGRVVWVRDRGTSSAGDDGDGSVVEGMLEDITALREAQTDLEEATARHRSVFDALSEGILLLDIDGSVIDANPSAERILGRTRDELLRPTWWAALAPTDLNGQPIAFENGGTARALATGEAALDVRAGITDEHGGQRWLSLNYEPLRQHAGGAPQGVVVSFRDITERRRNEEDLGLFAALVARSGDFIAIAGLDQQVIYLNEAGRALVGLERSEDVRHRRIEEFLTPEGLRASLEVEQPAVLAHGRWEGESTLRNLRTDAAIDVRISSFLVRHLETGEPWALATVQRDITEEKRAREEQLESQRRSEAQFRGLPVPTYAWQARGDDLVLLDCNDAALEITRGKITEMFGITAAELFADDPAVQDDLRRCLATRGSIWRAMEYRLRSTGDVRHLEVTYVFVPPDVVMAHTLDVTERRTSERRLRELADHDGLTGLLNRRRFEGLLGEHVGRDRGAVVLVDVDHFKFVNDSLGHAAGDELLRAIAACLRERTGPDDIVARLGGDEFAVLLPGVELQQAEAVAEVLLAAVRTQVTALTVTASAGVATYPPGSELAAPQVLVAADIALYQAKTAGRDRAATYGGAPGESLTWLDRVRSAIDEERLVLHAQPIIDLRTGELAMEELLVRMVDERGELIPPTSFLPTAEQFGLIRDIDRWVIRAGIRYASTGRRVHLNLSARSLSDPELPDVIAAELAAAGSDPTRVGFEYTETAAVSNIEDARGFTQRLLDLGCPVALDDFGTGFGSFLLLKHLPLSLLKIDMEFVRDLPNSPADQRIVRSIVHIAGEAGLRVVAEGVEDAETLSLLRGYGVDFAQGYHLGRPQPMGATPV